MSEINLTSVSLSPTDLTDMQTTPVELLPAPGGRIYYVIHQVWFHYRYGTVPYTGTFSPAVGYGTTVADIYSGAQIVNGAIMYASGWGAGVDPDHFVTLTQDAYMQCVPITLTNVTGSISAWTAALIEDLPLIVVNDPTATPIAGGDGTVSARVFWSQIDGAPSIPAVAQFFGTVAGGVGVGTPQGGVSVGTPDGGTGAGTPTEPGLYPTSHQAAGVGQGTPTEPGLFDTQGKRF
jgi:hypothetical protein